MFGENERRTEIQLDFVLLAMHWYYYCYYYCYCCHYYYRHYYYRC